MDYIRKNPSQFIALFLFQTILSIIFSLIIVQPYFNQHCNCDCRLLNEIEVRNAADIGSRMRQKLSSIQMDLRQKAYARDSLLNTIAKKKQDEEKLKRRITHLEGILSAMLLSVQVAEDKMQWPKTSKVCHDDPFRESMISVNVERIAIPATNVSLPNYSCRMVDCFNYTDCSLSEMSFGVVKAASCLNIKEAQSVFDILSDSEGFLEDLGKSCVNFYLACDGYDIQKAEWKRNWFK